MGCGLATKEPTPLKLGKGVVGIADQETTSKPRYQRGWRASPSSCPRSLRMISASFSARGAPGGTFARRAVRSVTTSSMDSSPWGSGPNISI